MHPAVVILLTSALTATAFWWVYRPDQRSGGEGSGGGERERRAFRTVKDLLDGVPVHPVVRAHKAEQDFREIIKVWPLSIRVSAFCSG